VCVRALSARLNLELSECKVYQPCEVILEWIKLYKVRRKPCGLSGSAAIVFDPPTLCGGRGDLLPWWRSSLLEAASSWPRELGDCLSGEPLWRVKWCSCGRDCDQGWLSAYRCHGINRVSRVCLLWSLLTFPNYSLVIFVCFYFPKVVSC
jgi:hypothetical protein